MGKAKYGPLYKLQSILNKILIKYSF
uniref:Uncharacterized protein n=1 Tax=Rhizophora mucronata TaxID=61149 RepID=A0A2P2NF11_RHIMU